MHYRVHYWATPLHSEVVVGPCLTVLFIGIYTGNTNQEEEAAFLTERFCFSDLLEGLKSPCPCGISNNAWVLSSLLQVNEPFVHCITYAWAIIERPCTEGSVCLSVLPSRKKDLVQLQDLWGPLLAQPEVNDPCTVYLHISIPCV